MKKQTKQKIAVPTPEDELQEKSNQIWMMQGQIQKLQKDLDEAQADARGRISYEREIAEIAEELFGIEENPFERRTRDYYMGTSAVKSRMQLSTRIIARIRELQTKLELSEKNAIGLQARLDFVTQINVNGEVEIIGREHE